MCYHRLCEKVAHYFFSVHTLHVCGLYYGCLHNNYIMFLSLVLNWPVGDFTSCLDKIKALLINVTNLFSCLLCYIIEVWYIKCLWKLCFHVKTIFICLTLWGLVSSTLLPSHFTLTRPKEACQPSMYAFKILIKNAMLDYCNYVCIAALDIILLDSISI